jgi:para-aminobenzoate synthetase/4-amino-4-deoxychorismate lyase
VRVPDLFTIERFPTVFQMTSTVEAQMREEIGLTEVFRALFPCGSVTGAPKIRTMQCIRALEQEPRGVYCGAIGIVRPGGDAVFNVAIRTLVQDTGTGIAEYGVGGGITWDSTAAEEWAETEVKAAVFTQPPIEQDFSLLETLRLEDGSYSLRERHLARLTDSATYFNRPVDSVDVVRALDAFAQEHPLGIWRVRLCVAPSGTPSVEGTAFAFSVTEPLPVMLAQTPVDSRNVFLFHKTTRREVYEEHRKALPDGVYDALLWNEQGEVTEFTSANIVAEVEGVCWTPPQSSGLLAGTFRAELLETGDIRTRTLTVAEVQAASRLWLINSVRGRVPVRLVKQQAG